MQSRSDSILNTGISGATISRLERSRQAREQRIKNKEAKKSNLTPAAEIVIEEINKERDAVTVQLLNLIDSTTDEEVTRSTIHALRLYRKSLDGMKLRLGNILRTRERFDE